MSQGSDLASTGQKIVLVGLAAQILWFGGFVVVSAVFHTRMRKYKVPEEQEQWLRLMYVLYAASGLILVRSLFRMVEFGQGHDGAIMADEVVCWFGIVHDSLAHCVVVSVYLRRRTHDDCRAAVQRVSSASIPSPDDKIQ